MMLTPSILITDDDRDFRETLGDLFLGRGFRTLYAGDGHEALGIVQSEPVHLLLIDMHMPRLTGIETLREVRARKFKLPCVLISAGLDDGLVEEARRNDVFSVLAKPVRVRDVKRVVNHALREVYNWPEPFELPCE